MIPTWMIIILAVALALAALFYLVRKLYHRLLARTFAQPAGPPIIRQGGSVIAYHPEVREIGEAILRAGGNAFDAFVAAAVAENVMAEGVSSLAGPLGILTYRAQDGRIAYLDADYNDPFDPTGRGSFTIFVPGAPAGLEELATKYGRLPFPELLQPAIALAEDGFQVNRMMALAIEGNAKILKKSKYGRSTFFPHGKALQAGEIIRQPEVAEFLRRLGKEGSAYVYNGDWGDHFLSVVEAHGGCLTTKDLTEYGVKWHEPLTTSYHGHTIHSSSGNSYGGLWVLLALKTLEQAKLPLEPRYWEDADALEKMIRISREVWSEPNIFDDRVLHDPETVRSLLTAEYASSMWERVCNQAPLNSTGGVGSHSYHLITTDNEGNVASGTTTIISGAWAEGLFVEGIPLPNAYEVPVSTKPGERRLGVFSIHLAFEDGQPRFAVGTISNSLFEASFQLLVKLIDYRMSVSDTVSTPRFGSFPDISSGRKLRIKGDRNWIDPRVDSSIVKTLKARGIKLQQAGLVDTGLGVVVRLGADGKVEGLPAPLPHLSNPFQSSAE